jgi:hypothetical protein
MKELVSDRRITVAASVSALLLGWGIVASPGDSWPGMLSMFAMAALLVTSTTVLLMGRLRAPAASLAQVIHEIDAEAAMKPSAHWKGKATL